MTDKALYFTLCSNNYLPFALALGASVRKFLPDAQFIIGLVDDRDAQVDYSAFAEFEVIPCFDLGYPEFEGMLSRYNIIEFNTAVKPFYFEYLFRSFPDVDQIFYLDPDLLFYQSPEVLGREFGDSEILLTPNLIFTQHQPSTGELASLRHGMYNLGFIGLKRGEESFRLIQNTAGSTSAMGFLWIKNGWTWHTCFLIKSNLSSIPAGIWHGGISASEACLIYRMDMR
jgi:hypothetical protein